MAHYLHSKVAGVSTSNEPQDGRQTDLEKLGLGVPEVEFDLIDGGLVLEGVGR